MITLFGRHSSDNTNKVTWCCGELGLKFAFVELQIGEAHLNSEVVAHNPSARVPVLIDGNVALFESNTIVRYLAASYGNGHLTSPNVMKRSQLEKWMDFQTSQLEYPISILHRGYIRNPGEISEDLIDCVRRQAEEAFLVLDRILVSQNWLGGREFSIADIPCGVMAYRWFSYPVRKMPMPALEAWYERLRLRPAFVRHVMVQLG